MPISSRAKYDSIVDKIWMPRGFYENAIKLLGKDISYDTVLDIGCGQGLLLKELAARFPKAYLLGLDFSARLIHRANIDRHAACILGDALHIPIKDETIDFAFCTEVIEHVNSPQELVGEIYRLLKPDGCLIITVPNRWAFYPGYAIIKLLPSGIRKSILRTRIKQLLLYSFLPSDDPDVSFQPIDHSYSSGELTRWLHQRGFTISKVKGYEYFRNLRPFPNLQRLLLRILKVPPIFAYYFFVFASKQL